MTGAAANDRAGTVGTGDAAAAVADLLVATGIPVDRARISARAIVLADVWGIASHGILRMPSYLQRIEAGGINVGARLRDVRRAGAVVAFDGEAGLGHWQVWHAVDVAVQLARTQGVAVAAIGNSSHCGALGVYAARIRAAGAAGMVLSNGPAAIPAPEGGQPLLSTSPVAGTAAPLGHGPVVDMALGAITRGQIARHARAGEPLEAGRAFDARGEPTTDPVAALAGMIAPIGGPKGFALGYLFEALTGLVGPGLSLDVIDPFSVEHGAQAQRVSHLVLVLRPDAVDLDGDAVSRLERLRAATTASGGRVPGGERRLALEGTVQLEESLRAELVAWARRVGARTAERLLHGP
ncbi:MAG: Ldh family oxidoreductase [Chloroflexi bacterium]|nr:Ldh family oxidoreductase [Chloroflexota bacterium]